MILQSDVKQRIGVLLLSREGRLYRLSMAPITGSRNLERRWVALVTEPTVLPFKRWEPGNGGVPSLYSLACSTRASSQLLPRPNWFLPYVTSLPPLQSFLPLFRQRQEQSTWD